MELRELGRSGLKVSALSLGAMNFGSDWLGCGAADEKTARSMLDAAADAGVNLVDTAEVYGHGASESMLGKLLKGRRSKFLIATKFSRWDRPMREALEGSLRRLKTDHVDLYMPHSFDPHFPLEDMLGQLERLKEQGKVRVPGCSNFRCGDWKAGLGRTRLEFDQVQFSLAMPHAERDLAHLLESERLSLLAWSPLGGGFLAGGPHGRRSRPEAFPRLDEKRLSHLLELLRRVAELERLSMAQTALAWVLSKPWVASATVGATRPEQLQETLKPCKLSPVALSLLDRAGRAVAGWVTSSGTRRRP
ncbi:MAG: aldo/keto reductase [Elusimicrobiota bacterium]